MKKLVTLILVLAMMIGFIIAVIFGLVAIPFLKKIARQKVSSYLEKKHKEKDESVIVVAHSSTLYALATFVNGVPENRKIVWMQCSNCAVVKS